MGNKKFSDIHDAIRQLEQYEKRTQELNNAGSVPFDAVFTSDFMKGHGIFYTSIEELATDFGKDMYWLETLDHDDERFDRFISSKTGFSGWEHLKQTAEDEYAAKYMGLDGTV